MLDIEPVSWVSQRFIVRSSEGYAGEINFRFWREQGDMRLGHGDFEVRREKATSGRFLLHGPSGVVAEASKPSAWRNFFLVDYNGMRFELRKASVWFRRFLVVAGTKEIGSVAPHSMWTRRAEAKLPENWPLEVKLFVVWLVLAMWNREAGAAVAMAGAA